MSKSITDILPPPFEWINIPGGEVTLEGEMYSYIPEDKTKTFTVEPFTIAKYPVTNAQYQVFLDAPDGYREKKWWDYSDDAKKWRANNPQPEEAKFSGGDFPRANVNWFDSLAFCRWLTARLNELDSPLLAEGMSVMLPTEQQWQRAAQGDDGREYPWGDEIDISYCNYDNLVSRVGRITLVTDYPKGASPYGVMDMSGNVWEWCLTQWGSGSNNYDSNEGRVLRGGSWSNSEYSALAANRYNAPPGLWSDFYGFRLVVAPI